MGCSPEMNTVSCRLSASRFPGETMAEREKQSGGTTQRVSSLGRPSGGPGAVEAQPGTIVGRNESWVNVYCSLTNARLTIPYCTGCVTVHRRLDKFRMILLELRARHRQSDCDLNCIALSSVGTTCLLHKTHCTRGLAKRSGLQQICSLR